MRLFSCNSKPEVIPQQWSGKVIDDGGITRSIPVQTDDGYIFTAEASAYIVSLLKRGDPVRGYGKEITWCGRDMAAGTEGNK